MRIGALFTAGLAAIASAAVTPQQLVDGINRITQLSQDLQAPATEITIVNAPLIIIGQGPFPTIITGFTQIVTTATVLIDQTSGTPEITDADAVDAVFDAYRAFVRVHQALLNILIGKAGILEKVPFIGTPVAAALRSVEGVVDTISIFLINTCQSRAQDFTAEANSLGNTLDLTIHKYEGLSV